eukprot:TRINITY_DN25685_c0_g1_i1.p1 TRINITY_DN25685_c0_g1~~TRINITY_DN25685_c0_g1_i1.p1  ORF type:complete len:497 (-),score=138.19 TRINITY_DN25685_c0_g1_i1:131-1621(-)
MSNIQQHDPNINLNQAIGSILQQGSSGNQGGTTHYSPSSFRNEITSPKDNQLISLDDPPTSPGPARGVTSPTSGSLTQLHNLFGSSQATPPTPANSQNPGVGINISSESVTAPTSNSGNSSSLAPFKYPHHLVAPTPPNSSNPTLNNSAGNSSLTNPNLSQLAAFFSPNPAIPSPTPPNSSMGIDIGAFSNPTGNTSDQHVPGVKKSSSGSSGPGSGISGSSLARALQNLPATSNGVDDVIDIKDISGMDFSPEANLNNSSASNSSTNLTNSNSSAGLSSANSSLGVPGIITTAPNSGTGVSGAPKSGQINFANPVAPTPPNSGQVPNLQTIHKKEPAPPSNLGLVNPNNLSYLSDKLSGIDNSKLGNKSRGLDVGGSRTGKDASKALINTVGKAIEEWIEGIGQEIEDEREKREEENEELRSRVSALEDRNKTLESEREGLTKKVSTLESQVDFLKSKLEQFERRLEESKKAASENQASTAGGTWSGIANILKKT